MLKIKLTFNFNISLDFAINEITKNLNIPLGNPIRRLCNGTGTCH